MRRSLIAGKGHGVQKLGTTLLPGPSGVGKELRLRRCVWADRDLRFEEPLALVGGETAMDHRISSFGQAFGHSRLLSIDTARSQP